MKVVLYARVSTEEQASNYSLSQQLGALREYCQEHGYEVLEEVTDPGWSGASLDRPGMDRVRDLVESGNVGLVLAQDRDRFAREPAYLYLLRKEFAEYATKVRALNDQGDNSPEGQLTDGILDQLAKFERAKTAERTRRGRLRKAREGKLIGNSFPHYGYRFNENKDNYEVEDTMSVVHEIFRLASGGESVHHILRTLEGKYPAPKTRWNRTTIRDIILSDVYKPFSFTEVSSLVARELIPDLDENKHYGIYWYNCVKKEQKQISETVNGVRTYRTKTRSIPRPREEWIPIPVPEAGVSLETVERARAYIRKNKKSSSAGTRFWELSGGIARCAECDRSLCSKPANNGANLYYFCSYRGKNDTCTNSRHYKAEELELHVASEVQDLLKNPKKIVSQIEEKIQQKNGGNVDRELEYWSGEIAKLEKKLSRAEELVLEGLLTKERYKQQIEKISGERHKAEVERGKLTNKTEEVRSMRLRQTWVYSLYRAQLFENFVHFEPRDRHGIYRKLGLKAHVGSEGVRISGVLDANIIPDASTAYTSNLLSIGNEYKYKQQTGELTPEDSLVPGIDYGVEDISEGTESDLYCKIEALLPATSRR